MWRHCHTLHQHGVGFILCMVNDPTPSVLFMNCVVRVNKIKFNSIHLHD